MKEDSKKYLKWELNLLKSELPDDFDSDDFINDLEIEDNNNV